MTVGKASVAGFAAGFIVSVVVAHIRVPRPGFLISHDKKERLGKKEAAARINDLLEDRELFFDIFLAPEEELDRLFKAIRLKALTEPRWNVVLERIIRS